MKDRAIVRVIVGAGFVVAGGSIAAMRGGAAMIQVRERDLEKVDEEIAQFQNEIKADISAIWRSAEPQYFQEPKLENLTRKVQTLLNERFGVAKEHNEPIVHKVVIVMSTGFRIDS